MNHYPKPFPPPWAEAWGDDRYGLWAELLVNGVKQRMRWLAPGSFLMGSPDPEPDRSKNEGPQHRVTLTEDLWLADTACTQALWRAVMGEDSMRYALADSNKPVEYICWLNVRDFFVALRAHTTLPPSIEVVLPTEAQWEYACRAGSTTAYNFGQLDSENSVNFNHGYTSWRRQSKVQLETTSVKSWPPNAWGLYEMHGNIWEQCADSLRKYTKDAVTNPCGLTGEEVREFAARGGPWGDFGQPARSAQRSANSIRRITTFFGFRFALRSTAQQGAGSPRLEGA